jgi:hypothetical protein
LWQEPITSRGEEACKADARNSAGDGRHDHDRPGCVRQGSSADALAPLQQGVANHEHREAAAPEHIELGAGLGPRTEETASRNQTGKGQYQRHRRERGEEIPARQDKDGAQSRSLKSDEQETGRYQTIEPKYRFRNRDEGLDARQRDPGKRDERTEATKDAMTTASAHRFASSGAGAMARNVFEPFAVPGSAHIADPDGSGSSGHLSICHGIDDPEDDLEVQRGGFPGWPGTATSLLQCDINQAGR